MAITIGQSQTADTRTCDFANVTKETLFESSRQHIRDVRAALDFFRQCLIVAGQNHDPDKLSDIDGFHADFVTGFKQTGWWDRHRQLNRHHIIDMAGNLVKDGIRDDVNLIDVLDYVADIVMAGKARSGEVTFTPGPEVAGLLLKALVNTVELLKSQVVVKS
jgi:hypothetical protein